MGNTKIIIPLKIHEAAKFLGFVGTSNLREKARLGLIPAHKPGRDWIFYQHELVDWLDKEYSMRREAAEVGIKGKNLWQLSRKRAAIICTQNSRSVESELMNLRKQIREQKHKSTKTSGAMK